MRIRSGRRPSRVPHRLAVLARVPTRQGARGTNSRLPDRRKTRGQSAARRSRGEPRLRATHREPKGTRMDAEQA